MFLVLNFLDKKGDNKESTPTQEAGVCEFRAAQLCREFKGSLKYKASPCPQTNKKH